MFSEAKPPIRIETCDRHCSTHAYRSVSASLFSERLWESGTGIRPLFQGRNWGSSQAWESPAMFTYRHNHTYLTNETTGSYSTAFNRQSIYSTRLWSTGSHPQTSHYPVHCLDAKCRLLCAFLELVAHGHTASGSSI